MVFQELFGVIFTLISQLFGGGEGGGLIGTLLEVLTGIFGGGQ